MVDFHIDTLNLSNTGGNNYTLTGACNTDNANAHAINARYSSEDTQVIFHGGAFPQPHQLTFNPKTINFTDYGGRELLYIMIGNDAAKPKDKGGVVIVTTNYPPPSEFTWIKAIKSFFKKPVSYFQRMQTTQSAHRVFSEIFTIDNFLVQRKNFTDQFDLTIDVSYPVVNNTGYLSISSALVTDPINGIDAIVLTVDPISPPPLILSMRFTIPDLTLKNYTRGVSVIIMDTVISWEEIDTKKAGVFIK